MSVTLTHETTPEQAEAAVYAALAADPAGVVVKVHGFPTEALDVILGRLPDVYKVKGRGTSRVVIAADLAARVGSGSATAWERFASFNALGSHHTDPGGKNAGLASGKWRMNHAVKLWNDQGVTVVTLSEFETPQRLALLSHPRWAVFSAIPNNHFRDGNTMGNAIAWRKDVWELVDSYSIPVPITSRRLYMAAVILRHRKTGLYSSFIAIHNPSTGPISGGSQADRENAKRIERDYAARLVDLGLPVVLGGDFNEHDAAQAFPSLDRAVSAGVDFLFVDGAETKGARVKTKGVRGVLTDHPLVSALVGLFSSSQPTGKGPRLPRGLG